MKIKCFVEKWCPPCRMFTPVLSEFCEAHDIPLEIIDCDSVPELVKELDIAYTPTTVIYTADGTFMLEGNISFEELEEQILPLL